MKKSIYLLLAALTLSVAGAKAQDNPYANDPKYGDSPDSRLQNATTLMYFNDAFKAKDFDKALGYLHKLLDKAPICSENMYEKGVVIYRGKVMRAASKEEKGLYIDSIMWLHDKRMTAFNDHPSRGKNYIMGRKALDYFQLAPADQEKIFTLFKEAIEAGKPNIQPELAVIYFNALTDAYKLDNVTPDQLINEYEQLTAMLGASQDPAAAEARQAIETLFASSGGANCDVIERIYRPKYEADPNNQQVIEQILGLFSRGNCENDFYMNLVEQYYKINPKPEVALMLAGFFEKKQNPVKALEYIQVAVQNETDPAKKVNYLTRAAGASLQNNDYRGTASMAKQVLGMDPTNGLAYFLLANAYANGSASACSGFDRQCAYWIVVDNLLQARKYLPEGDPAQANISRMIGSYVGNFPKAEETFMRGLNPGDSYNVNCGWISGTTTVRER